MTKNDLYDFIVCGSAFTVMIGYSIFMMVIL